jgi:ABC-type branched-subunit amino acid transport system substrate-binding protein
MVAAPMRVGVLNDMADVPSGSLGIEPWLRLAIDELLTAGRLDREVEFVFASGLGLPQGTAAAVEHAYRRLVDEDVLLIVGPAIGDNALVATPLAEVHRVPTINWAGSERARGEHMFHLQVGSHEDEAIVLAQHLAAIGASRLGVLSDRSPIGRRYLHFLLAEAEVLGLEVAASATLAPLAEDAGEEVGRVLAAEVDALVCLGLGLVAPAVARAATALGFIGPRVMNTAGMRGYQPDFGRAIDGWTYLDMHSDSNRILVELRRRLDLDPSTGSGPAKGWDLGRLVAEGLARAPELTRAGLREGLEQIKWLPAAEGHEGTLLSFGHQDRGALHGRYLVLRRWQDGSSVELASSG